MRNALGASRTRRQLRVAAATAAISLFSQNLHAQTVVTSWLGGTGDWYDAAKWSHGVPDATTAVRIVQDGTAQLTGGNAFAVQVDLGTSGTLSGAGALVHTDGTLNVTGGLSVGSQFAGSYQLSGAFARLVATGQERVGRNAAGTFTQTAGTHSVGNELQVGAGNVGVYQLSGGTLEVGGELQVGRSSSGALTQTAGVVVGVDANALLYVGFSSGANGSYQLQAGSLDVARQIIANGGSGTFNQTGGTNTAATSLSIRTASGRYNLTGGTLSVANFDSLGTFNFAPGGTGTFEYSGLVDFSKGTVTNANQGHVIGGASSLLVLPIGANPATYFGTLATAGLVHVAGNTLNVPAGRTVNGIGTFADHVNMTGGTLSGTLTLSRGLSMSAGSNASLPLLIIQNATSGMTGGTLATSKHYVGDNTGGTFTQTGGTNTTDLLAIRAGSRYVFSSGSLQTNQSFEQYGTIDFGGGSGGALSVTGIADLATGTMLSPSQVDVTVAASSLLLVPSGFNPATQFKSFINNGGTVHVAGTPLSIPAGTTITGGGATISDHLTVEGTLNGTYPIHTAKGVTVPAGGVANFASGFVAINDLTSAVNGGTLTQGSSFGSSALSVGQVALGRFTLESGSVTAAFVYVGENSAGTLVQNGGTLRSNTGLRVGLNAGSSGTYTFASGTLSALGSHIGVSSAGSGTFNQVGGTHTTTSVTLGTTGTYNLSAGTLVTPADRTGIVVNGVFNQSGGDIVTTTLTVGGSTGGAGSYNMTGGTVTGNPFVPVTPTTPAITVVNSGGRFTLAGGTLNAGVGVKGTFVQTGGTLTGSIDVTGTGRVTLAAGAGVTPKLTGVVIADSGKLDIKDNAMVLTGFSAVVGTRFFGSTYNGITGLIQSGHHAGDWNGTKGIITTMPDAAAGLTSIGIATAGQAGYAGSTFRGISASAGSVIVMYTYAGDANLDGFISGDDYAAIDFNIAVPNASGWYNGDFNYDGIISGDDYAAIDFNIVAQGAPFPVSGSAGPGGVTAVPEPAVGAFIAAIGPLLIRPRCRKFACG